MPKCICHQSHKQCYLRVYGQVIESFINLCMSRIIFSMCLLICSPFEGISNTDIGLNLQQRKGGMFTVGQAVNIEVFHPSAEVAVNTMTVSVDLLIKKQGNKGTIDSGELTTFFKHFYSTQVFRAGQTLAVDFNGQKLDLAIVSFEHADINGTGAKNGPFGQLLPVT
ncbi:hypothetical protein EON64_01290, partial [archaeon]